MTENKAAKAFRGYFTKGDLGELGSFYSALLRAYTVADGKNRAALDSAFPAIGRGYQAAFHGFSTVDEYAEHVANSEVM